MHKMSLTMMNRVNLDEVHTRLMYTSRGITECLNKYLGNDVIWLIIDEVGFH